MESLPRTHVARAKSFSYALACVMFLTTIPIGASAELPHENFDLVGSDLEMVIALLNSSIRASENALVQFYEEDVPEADQYMSMASAILTPANQILSEIQDLAGSYENLSSLLPPFLQLHGQMGEWSSQEESLLGMRDDIVTASQLANLTDEDLIAAITAIRTVHALILSMNHTIDDMLVSADAISALTIEGEQVFVPNELRPLIEKLRDLLVLLLAEIEDLIYNDIPWAFDPTGQERAFVLLWLADAQLYLGEPIIGGGYLYYNGSFRSGQSVHILMNSSEIQTVTTGLLGSFSFVQQVPINASWLGAHTFVATATTPFVNLTSEVSPLSIVLMPSTMRISADKTLISINEFVAIEGELVDVYDRPIPNGTCRLVMDASTQELTTSVDGEFGSTYAASEIRFGTHLVQAFFDPELPYSASQSNSIDITVSIPTDMTFRLFSAKFRPGYYIVGNGSLFANISDPLVGERVTIYIDGLLIQNVTTTAGGEFAISIPVGSLERGTHIIRAAFEFRDIMWRYCEVDVAFTVTSLKPGEYPFFPFFPGWEGGYVERFPYLFFGENAYYTWLFVLIVIAILVKAIQVRRSKKKLAERQAAMTEGSPIAPFDTDMIAQALAEGDKMFESLLSHSPSDPNGRIIWYYNSLITFLTRKRRITITDDMTHWEVARLLQTLGFPRENVEKITMLFEKALYSGRVLDDIDSVSMSVAMDALRGKKTGGAAPAG